MVNMNQDGTLKLKARIDRHGRKDCDYALLKNDCCIYVPTGICILLSIAIVDL